MTRRMIISLGVLALAACGSESAPTPDLGPDHTIAGKDLAREQTSSADLPRPDQGGAPDACTTKSWYADQDGDGYGDAKTLRRARRRRQGLAGGRGRRRRPAGGGGKAGDNATLGGKGADGVAGTMQDSLAL